jgi:hypothetical protein
MWMIYRQISELKKMRLSANGQGVYGFDTEASVLPSGIYPQFD